MLKRGWLGFVVGIAVHGAAAADQPWTIGASLGMELPADRLVSRTDELGATLLPGPAVALHLVREGLAGRPEWACEGSLEMASFQSRSNPALRTQYLPLDLGASWEATDLRELVLRLRAGGGPALVSTNLGATRTVALAETYAGGRVQRTLSGLTVALDVSVAVLWQARARDTIRVQLVVLTR